MTTNKTPALTVQIGGDHYKDCPIQPVEFITANKLEFLEGCVVKRVTRHNKPTGKGRQDIEKALHELQLILELRYPIAANDNKDIASYSDRKEKQIRLGNCKASCVTSLCGESTCPDACKAAMNG